MHYGRHSIFCMFFLLLATLGSCGKSDRKGEGDVDADAEEADLMQEDDFIDDIIADLDQALAASA